MSLEFLGLLAGLLLLASSFPQLREALAEGSEGVSIGSWSIFLAGAAVWTAYGVHIGAPAAIYANVGGVIAFGILVTALVRIRSGSTLLALLVPLAVAAVIGVALLAPTALVGLVGVVLGICLAVPQLLLSWRTRDEPSRVSVSAWALVVVGQVLWLAYGVLRPDGPIIVVNAISLLVTTGVLLLALRGRAAGPGAGAESAGDAADIACNDLDAVTTGGSDARA